MKKVLVSLVLAIILLFNTNVYAYDKISDTRVKVYDFAGVLTDTEEEKLQDRAESYIKKTNFDMVIVTVNRGYNDAQIEAYADDFYDYNHFGEGEDNSGIIIAIDVAHMDENYYYIAIETTGDAIKVYTDSKIDRMFNHLGNNKKYGVYRMINGFVDDADTYYRDPNAPAAIPYFGIFIGSLIISLIVLGVLIKKNKLVQKATQASAYLDKSNVQITNRQDRYITTTTSRVRINTNSGGGGGSSIHRGSSGISHGGGGRRV